MSKEFAPVNLYYISSTQNTESYSPFAPRNLTPATSVADANAVKRKRANTPPSTDDREDKENRSPNSKSLDSPNKKPCVGNALKEIFIGSPTKKAKTEIKEAINTKTTVKKVSHQQPAIDLTSDKLSLQGPGDGYGIGGLKIKNIISLEPFKADPLNKFVALVEQEEEDELQSATELTAEKARVKELENSLRVERQKASTLEAEKAKFEALREQFFLERQKALELQALLGEHELHGMELVGISKKQREELEEERAENKALREKLLRKKQKKAEYKKALAVQIEENGGLAKKLIETENYSKQVS